jgi:MFS family permease
MFGLFGLLATSWMGRLPSIRDALNISTAQLGALLIVGAVGSLLSVTLAGAIIMRYGSRTVLWFGAWGALTAMIILAAGVFTGFMPLFIVGLLLNGLFAPYTNTTINLEGARIEKYLGFSVLPHMHAAFPVGAALGSAFAAATAALNIDATWHILTVVTVVAIARVLLINPGTALADPPSKRTVVHVDTEAPAPAHGQAAPIGKKVRPAALAAWLEPRTLAIGLVLFAATMSEGAAGNWLNIGVVDGFGVGESVGALAYGTFVVSMLSVRLLGVQLLRRFGRLPVLYVSGATAVAGLVAFGLSPLLPLAWLGIILWGMGAAMAWPVAMAASADDPAKAAARVSVTSSFASVAMLGAPPVLGLLAHSWGVRQALLIIVAALAVSLAATRAAREETVDNETLADSSSDSNDGSDATPATPALLPVR